MQRGLLDIYPVFLRHGFFWGAAFGREDAMHFEASDQLVRKWAAEGKFLTGKVTRAEHERLPPGQHLVRDWPIRRALTCAANSFAGATCSST